MLQIKVMAVCYRSVQPPRPTQQCHSARLRSRERCWRPMPVPQRSRPVPLHIPAPYADAFAHSARAAIYQPASARKTLAQCTDAAESMRRSAIGFGSRVRFRETTPCAHTTHQLIAPPQHSTPRTIGTNRHDASRQPHGRQAQHENEAVPHSACDSAANGSTLAAMRAPADERQVQSPASKPMATERGSATARANDVMLTQKS